MRTDQVKQLLTSLDPLQLENALNALREQGIWRPDITAAAATKGSEKPEKQEGEKGGL
jgi:hypothetical protein